MDNPITITRHKIKDHFQAFEKIKKCRLAPNRIHLGMAPQKKEDQ